MGSSALGKPGKPAEAVGDEAALKLDAEIASNAPFDSHLADQLMIFMALAKGKSRIRTSEITTHVKTNAWLIEQFIGKRISISESSNIIEINGIGLEPYAGGVS